MGSVALIEGWGLFSEEIAAESGFFEYAGERTGCDPQVLRLFYMNAKLLRAGRMVADPSLQMGLMTPSQVEEYLVDECLQDQQFAKGQARYYPNVPGYSSTYYPGYLFLKALRDLVVETLDGFMDEKQARYFFYQTYLAECGCMPGPLVSRHVLVRALQKRESLGQQNPD